MFSGGNYTFRNASSNTTVGWVGSSDHRGTLDILYSSGATILLCVWISTYPNIPAPRDRLYHRLIDKFNLAMIGFLGPDLLFALALGQWSSARRSVEEFRRVVPNDKDRSWSITHGFYADMGGFRIVSNREEDGIPTEDGIPVNAKQLLYLIEHEYIDIPSLKEKEIKAMSASDTFSKVLVLWQVCWFTVTEVMRFGYHAPITTLELTAFIFAVMMLATSFAWFQKPQITRSTCIKLRNGLSFQDIRDTARTSTHPNMQDRWYETPLDFIWKRGSFQLDKQWQYFSYLSHLCRVPLFTRLPSGKNKAWERMPSDIWYRPRGFLVPLGLVVQVPFCLSFLGAWKFHFATRAEQVLWRTSAVYHAAYSLVITIYYILGLGEQKHTDNVMALPAQINQNYHQPPPAESQLCVIVPSKTNISILASPTQVVSSRCLDTEQGLISQKISLNQKQLPVARYWRNLSPGGDPDQEISLRWTTLLFILTVIYIFSHLYIYLEDIISLRSQPAEVFLANNQFFPLIS
ncbi:hypothetical protein MANI_030314 [Metarhizium anisopliae]|uniref:Uncharacterized protein n=1 Tax=Metarhizium anisopliae BRIP 53293 TaxID=1291518 RepID=A0A0D9NL28_METAN|nr:hypothetical protein MANI_030314 [Metarhizium anisopliae]KJK74639.1 hypothetical protein H634G_09950 [Metarhizium anisopliae BRIP 53293]KJK88395.1 hypothetical protein H633G_07735 [Metarhizium anisopliae BRIP 53284]